MLSNLEIFSGIEALIGDGADAEKRIMKDVSLSQLTTFKTGGPADIVVRPSCADELASVTAFLRKNEIPFIVLGNGSNVLASDEGFRGVVIVIGNEMAEISVSEAGTVSAEAGAMLGEVARAAARNSLTGLEFASGIPGSIGGGVFMNAGAYGGEMADVVENVTAVMPDGSIKVFEKNELDFAYRHSVFCDNGAIIIRVEMKLAEGNEEEILAQMKELNRKRVEKQPLNYPSAGSTFKRPEGYFAGKLIEDSGCKGLTVGGAMVSPKHAGFVVNKGGASSEDILELIRLVQMRVKDEFGVDLETEVKLI